METQVIKLESVSMPGILIITAVLAVFVAAAIVYFIYIRKNPK